MVNKVKTGLVALAFLGAAATPGMAQSESQVGASVRFPISKSFFKGAQVGVVGQYGKIQDEDAVYGGEAGLYFRLNSIKPSFEAKVFGGDGDTLGKAGIGYDFAKEDGYTSLAVQHKNAELGLNFLKENGTQAYIGANTFGSLPEYNKSTAVGTTVVAPVVEEPTITPPPGFD
ncbi:MAG: hypothetical protein PF569_06565 [Candidatus Woesearchaeota archaeon]|jgi:hypothetical protein|nr:hypothetical protein [Candidatus Woesearchaeota archaeon]